LLILTLIGSENAPLEQCEQYRRRRTLRGAERRLPPMLYTFPGSGNTWCRLLIEYGTGILSGSVYNDKKLKPSLPGELMCDTSVSVVKLHPHTHPFSKISKGSVHSDATKCRRGGVRKFHKGIFLVRDPYAAIFSEYQRLWTTSHTGTVDQTSFDLWSWRRAAAYFSHRYYEMLSVDYPQAERKYGSGNITYARYEDLLNPEIRITTLHKIINATNLKIPIGQARLQNQPHDQAQGDGNHTQHRLECAFTLAATGRVKRPRDRSSSLVNAHWAYKQINDLICPMWRLFGEHAERFGYKLLNVEEPEAEPTKCPTQVAAIPDEPRGLHVRKPKVKPKGKAKVIAKKKPGKDIGLIKLDKDGLFLSESDTSFEDGKRTSDVRQRTGVDTDGKPLSKGDNSLTSKDRTRVKAGAAVVGDGNSEHGDAAGSIALKLARADMEGAEMQPKLLRQSPMAEDSAVMRDRNRNQQPHSHSARAPKVRVRKDRPAARAAARRRHENRDIE
jgi:hypothetical protein